MKSHAVMADWSQGIGEFAISLDAGIHRFSRISAGLIDEDGDQSASR